MAVELFEEHSAILEAAESFLAAIKRTPRPSIDEVTRLRVRLSARVRQHRLTEEEFIFGPLMREGGLGKLPHLGPKVQELMREKVRYSEHVRKWTPQAIERDWHGYVEACEARILSLRHVITEEETCIYQAVLALNAAGAPKRAQRG